MAFTAAKKERIPVPPRIANEAPTYHRGYRAQNGTEIRYQEDWARQHQLEGDGLLPLLYDHLYKSDKTREHRLKGVAIPDTVIFDHNFPRAWYAYDTKSQEIIKRPGRLLESHSIFEAFGEEEGGCDIVAQFFSRAPSVPIHSSSWRNNRSTTSGGASSARSPSKAGGVGNASMSTPRGGTANTNSSTPNIPPKSPRGSNQQLQGSGRGGPQNQSTTDAAEMDDSGASVQFFTRATLYEFVYHKKVKPDGILQKFVLPKGQTSTMSNFMMQAVWSPLVTLVYKRTCKKRLSDHTGSSVTERAATFDGPPFHSVESLVAVGTKDAMNNICKKIVQHFFITEHKPITRMILYFKTDSQDNLQLLWCSSLRVGGDKLNPSYLRVPLHLAMHVQNASFNTAGEVPADQRTLRQVLSQDVLMYNLTGDLAFAAKCSETITHERSRALGGPTSPTSTPRGNNPQQHDASSSTTAATAPKLLGASLPPPVSADGPGPAGSAAHNTSTLSGAGTPALPPLRPPSSASNYQQQHQQSHRTHSPGDQQGHTTSPHTGDLSPRRFFVASRAPFLIQDTPPEVVPVSDRKHPLHEAYVYLYGGDGVRGSGAGTGGAIDGAGTGGGLSMRGRGSSEIHRMASSSSTRTRTNTNPPASIHDGVRRHSSNGGPACGGSGIQGHYVERLVARTEHDLVREELRDAMHDAVYRAHSRTLDDSTTAVNFGAGGGGGFGGGGGNGVGPTVGGGRVLIELAKVLFHCLTPKQLWRLLDLARLVPDRADDNRYTSDERRAQLRQEEEAKLQMAGKHVLIGYRTISTGLPAIGTASSACAASGNGVDGAGQHHHKALTYHRSSFGGGGGGTTDGEGGGETPVAGNLLSETRAGGGGTLIDEGAETRKEQRANESLDPSMRFTVHVGAIGRGYRRDRPVAQILRDIDDYFMELFSSQDEESDLGAGAGGEDGDVGDAIVRRYETFGGEAAASSSRVAAAVAEAAAATVVDKDGKAVPPTSVMSDSELKSEVQRAIHVQRSDPESKEEGQEEEGETATQPMKHDPTKLDGSDPSSQKKDAAAASPSVSPTSSRSSSVASRSQSPRTPSSASHRSL